MTEIRPLSPHPPQSADKSESEQEDSSGESAEAAKVPEETSLRLKNAPPTQKEGHKAMEPETRLSTATRRKLGRFERRWTAGVFNTLYPANAVEGMPGAEEVGLLEFHEDYLSRLPLLSHVGLRAAIFFVAMTPLFFIGIPLPLHRLTETQGETHMRRWANSRIYWIRECITLIKAATLMGYAGDPRVRQALGMEASP